MGTALDCVKSFLYRENIPVPAGISFESPTDPATLQLLHLLYAVCEELRQVKVWPVQKRKYSFDLEASRTQYPLPQDFYAPLLMTHYDQDDTELLDGPLSDHEMGYRLYGLSRGYAQKGYRIFGPDFNPNTGKGQFEIDPSDSAGGRTISFEYISRNLFLPKHWAPSTAYTSGMYVNVSGNIYLCDTNGTSSTTPPSTQAANITDGTTRWDYVSAAYEAIVDDNDINLFDDDLVKLGLRAKYFEGKGEVYEVAQAEFNRKIEQAKARHMGSYIGSLVGRERRPRFSLPAGGW